MMNKFKYELDTDGFPISYGYSEGLSLSLDGTEPFSGFDIINWRKDMEAGKWVSALKNYSYFILPLDLVPAIKHYSDWVKEAYPEKIFDVVLGIEEIEVEGQMVTVPTNILKMIPCGITAFNPEGEMLLEAVIESWNTQAPNKAIDFNVKFYSLTELDNFIASCGSSL